MSDPDGQALPVVVVRDEVGWDVGALPARLGDDLDGLIAALRQQPPDAVVIGLVDVFHEFFVAVRAGNGPLRLLLSDVTAAVAWDLARDVCDHLDIDAPADDDLEDVLPAGDLSIFADLGCDELQLGAILSDPDLYADEQLVLIGAQLGFAAQLERVTDAATR